MEEQTLHYYLKIFNILLIFLFFFILYIYFFLNKNLLFNYNPINIKKGANIEEIINTNINNLSEVEIELFKIYFKINKIIKNNFIHYGDFKINDDASLLDFINTITKPSNILTKITIVEGWSKKKLDIELSKFFDNFYSIPHSDIIADTYFIQKNTDFNFFINKLKDIKKNFFLKYQNNKLLNKFSIHEIMIIASLLEKEGLDELDKKKISSVIFNRLNANMKLQIDATVLYAITNGDYKLERKLLLRDLKLDHPFNTYIYNGLPPQPISYVGKKTLDILFENYQTDFMFYFFDNSLKMHIFSKTYKEHKQKLNEYRNK